MSTPDPAVTLKTLSLGARNATTGRYAEYFAESTIDMWMLGPSGEHVQVSSGGHFQLSVTGYTKTAVKKGDHIVDDFDDEWAIVGVLPWNWGNINGLNQAELSLIMEGAEGGTEGVSPGEGIGVVSPFILEVDSIAEIRILNVNDDDFTIGPLMDGVVASLAGVGEIRILNTGDDDFSNGILLDGTVASLVSVASITIPASSWYVDVGSNWTEGGDCNVEGWQTVTDGNTLAVVFTPRTANGYVCPETNPFTLDGAGCGTTDASGEHADYTVPDQAANSLHQLLGRPFKGFGVVASSTTTNGYHAVASGGTHLFTQAIGGAHWQWKLDGANVGTDNQTYTVPAQTDGTFHTVTVVNP